MLPDVNNVKNFLLLFSLIKLVLLFILCLRTSVELRKLYFYEKKDKKQNKIKKMGSAGHKLQQQAVLKTKYHNGSQIGRRQARPPKLRREDSIRQCTENFSGTRGDWK